MRFFFDYKTQDQSVYDYHGEDFRGPQDAAEYAKAIADHLRQSLSNAWEGWCVEVRNEEGERFISLPLDSAVA
jgi:hypothetical protein